MGKCGGTLAVSSLMVDANTRKSRLLAHAIAAFSSLISSHVETG